MSSSANASAGPSSLRSIKPPQLQGMKVLDREAFKMTIPILAAKVRASQINVLRSKPEIREQILDLPKTTSITSIPGDTEHRLLRLRVSSEDQLPETVLEILKGEGSGQLVNDSLKLDYDYWSTSDILNSVLPQSEVEEIPSGFTLTGHIGHVNLRDEWLPYKNIIGQVILDKNHHLRTVVNKLNNIHAQYRYFDMEVLAGDQDYITTVSESSCSFTFDFSKVYWNSRLHTEHARLVSLLQPDEVVVDVMAGVGPFAIPAAKKGCSVWGNDLNPESVKWMEVNRVTNKVQSTLRVSCVDGREFIQTAPLKSWQNPFQPFIPPRTARSIRAERKQRKEKAQMELEANKQGKELEVRQSDLTLIAAHNPPSTDGEVASSPTHQVSSDPINTLQSTTLIPHLPSHYIMNLPDSALTFLNAFESSYVPLLSEQSFLERHPNLEVDEPWEDSSVPMPLIHVYGFTREMEYPAAEKDMCERATNYLGHPVTPSTSDFHLHLVRSVAPHKEMYCLTFRLPREVAFKSARRDEQ